MKSFLGDLGAKNKIMQTGSRLDCAGSGSGLEGLVFMDGGKHGKQKSSDGC